MGCFGIDNLEHIPPHQKNAFWGVRGVGGAPGGRFFAHFLCFLEKSYYRFIKEVESEYSVVEDS